jgi:hypothetical protein
VALLRRRNDPQQAFGRHPQNRMAVPGEVKDGVQLDQGAAEPCLQRIAHGAGTLRGGAK